MVSPAPAVRFLPLRQLSRSPFPPQDLLKHTPEDHPDHPLLLDAQRNIKQVAERINKGVRSAEEAERHARVLQEIEAHIEGMEDVRAPPCLAPVCFCVCHLDCGHPCLGRGLWCTCFCDHSAPPLWVLLLLICLTLCPWPGSTAMPERTGCFSG